MAEKSAPLEVKTQVAQSGYHEHLFFDQKVFAELAGKATFSELLSLGICGRKLSAEQCGVLDDLAACWTIADPRIWPLKAARITASFGSTLAGVAAGMLAMDCHYVGVYRTTPAAASFLRRVRAGREQTDAPLETLLSELLGERRYIPGYGVPFRATDERVAPFRACLKHRGERQTTPFYSLFEAVGQWTERERKMPPNIAGAAAAALLDMGLDDETIGALTTALSLHMFFANAFEGAKQKHPALQALPEQALVYRGREKRLSPLGASRCQPE